MRKADKHMISLIILLLVSVLFVVIYNIKTDIIFSYENSSSKEFSDIQNNSNIKKKELIDYFDRKHYVIARVESLQNDWPYEFKIATTNNKEYILKGLGYGSGQLIHFTALKSVWYSPNTLSMAVIFTDEDLENSKEIIYPKEFLMVPYSEEWEHRLNDAILYIESESNNICRVINEYDTVKISSPDEAMLEVISLLDLKPIEKVWNEQFLRWEYRNEYIKIYAQPEYILNTNENLLGFVICVETNNLDFYTVYIDGSIIK